MDNVASSRPIQTTTHTCSHPSDRPEREKRPLLPRRGRLPADAGALYVSGRDSKRWRVRSIWHNDFFANLRRLGALGGGGRVVLGNLGSRQRAP